MRLITTMVLVLLIAACATTPTQDAKKDAPTPGKIHIRYLYTAADEQTPPIEFRIYRSDTRTGPFTLITPEPVLAKKAPRTGDQQLLHTDHDVALGDVYYYYLAKRASGQPWRKETRIARAEAVLPADGKKD